VAHGSEVPYVYGGVTNGSSSANNLSSRMIDYWVSFAANLDPNDGHGSDSVSFNNAQYIYTVLLMLLDGSGVEWAQYTPKNQVCGSLLPGPAQTDLFIRL
jgi:Carboxylesterase family